MENTHILTLLRHAKSSWIDQELSDHDRPLNARGQRDAPQMAIRLLNNGPLPDLILSSTAARAQATANYLLTACAEWQCQPEFQTTEALYLASTHTILQVLGQLGSSHRHIVVVAHNPGLEDLSVLLSDHECMEPMPTAAIRQFSCPDWPVLERRYQRSAHQKSKKDDASQYERASLIYLDYPKKTS